MALDFQALLPTKMPVGVFQDWVPVGPRCSPGVPPWAWLLPDQGVAAGEACGLS